MVQKKKTHFGGISVQFAYLPQSSGVSRRAARSGDFGNYFINKCFSIDLFVHILVKFKYSGFPKQRGPKVSVFCKFW